VPDNPDTDPPIEYVFVVHVTATLVTFAEPTVPLPWPTVQVWPLGLVFTVAL
jgi:hypothetical protein